MICPILVAKAVKAGMTLPIENFLLLLTHKLSASKYSLKLVELPNEIMGMGFEIKRSVEGCISNRCGFCKDSFHKKYIKILTKEELFIFGDFFVVNACNLQDIHMNGQLLNLVHRVARSLDAG